MVNLVPMAVVEHGSDSLYLAMSLHIILCVCPDFLPTALGAVSIAVSPRKHVELFRNAICSAALWQVVIKHHVKVTYPSRCSCGYIGRSYRNIMLSQNHSQMHLICIESTGWAVTVSMNCLQFCRVCGSTHRLSRIMKNGWIVPKK